MNKIKSKIKVSVITACFNNKKTINNTFSSLLLQTHNNIEYIIVDGGSKDGTLEVIVKNEKDFNNTFTSFKLISEKDNGIADAWNKGLKLATGDIIFFLNSDDWIANDTIAKAVNVLDINTKEITYGICNRIDYDEKFIGKLGKKFNKYRVIWNFGFSFTTVFCTRKVYDDVGNFNNKFKIAIDSDFLLRCISKNINFIRGNHEVFMRLGGVSTKFRLDAHKEYKKALIENGYPKILVQIAHLFHKFL